MPPADADEDKAGLRRDALGPAAKAFGKEVQPVGRDLGKLARYVLSPVSGLVWGVEKIVEKIGGRVEQIVADVPPEKLVEASPRISGPVLNAARYAGDDEEIQELFAQLLASDIQIDKKSRVHPSFVEIIKQMSTEDAVVMQEVSRDKGSVVLEFLMYQERNAKTYKKGLHYVSTKPEGLDWNDVLRSLSSLVRLGLLSIDYTSYPVISNNKNEEMESERKRLEDTLGVALANSGGRIAFRVAGHWITALGQDFVSVCLPLPPGPAPKWQPTTKAPAPSE